MKSFFFSLTLLLLLVSCKPQDLTTQSKGSTPTKEVEVAAIDSISYGLGILMAQNLKSQGLEEINTTDLAKGIEDVLQNATLKMDLATANTKIKAYMEEQQKMALTKNLKAGEAYLAANAKRPEVTVLPSGLQYEVITEGKGAKPSETDKVSVHYHGTLIDGKVFDSSVERGTPATFPVNGVIPGWVEGLQLMPVGSKWKLFIPANLAYGARGAGDDIGPNSALVFEVELISIN